MTPLPPVPSVLRVQIQYILSGRAAATNLHFAWSGSAPTDADCSQLGDLIGGQWATHCAALASTAVTVTGIRVTDLTSTSAGDGISTGSTSGTRTGGQLPSGISAMAIYHVAARYRGGKPKSFLPFGVEADLYSSQTWTGTFNASVAAGWASFIAGVEGLSYGGTTIGACSTVSYFQGYDPPTVAPNNRAKNHPKLRSSPVVYVVQSITYPLYLGEIRKRRGKV